MLEELTHTKRQTTPPKRWLNWYRATDGFEFESDPNPTPGFTYWPSLEVAEAKALEAIEAYVRKGIWPRGAVEWAGAFPEGEKP